MKVYIGPPTPHWTTNYVEQTYLKKMHKVKYGWQVEEEDYTGLDEAVIWLLDKWQSVLNVTVNKYFAWKKQKIKVHIDGYDVWSADHTLAYVIHPILVKLRETLHGSPNVDDEDVPDELKSTAAPPKEKEYDTDDNHHKRWEWVLDEMIWAFAQIIDDEADSQFHTGVNDIQFKTTEVDGKKMHEMVYGQWNARIANGLRLFGKYYRGLWD